ncbi:MAG: hypothetical protein KatS3mg050_4116 [Litorilinea sp.]|nr:MAG: hypothetical protein KatS3mg050_4116 [Litorilinea sp.]
MFTLENDTLVVSILDPENDLDRCGSRYCVGGYIYQVTDRKRGPLLSGPQYPDPFPDVFDGQGAPDMFVAALGADAAPVGGEVGVIGVGRVRRSSPVEPFSVRHNPHVIEFVPWTVEAGPTAITMATGHTFGPWAYRLTRQVELHGRTLLSRTHIQSLGEAPLPIVWFAHPFFPWPAGPEICRFSIPVNLPEQEAARSGYYLDDAGYICRKSDYDWARGCYQALDFRPTGDPLVVEQRHPVLGRVTAETDFAPSFLPIWGNDRTFSFEPYFQTELARHEAATWSIRYQF